MTTQTQTIREMCESYDVALQLLGYLLASHPSVRLVPPSECGGWAIEITVGR